MDKSKKQYGVWIKEDEGGYWSLYESVKDAILTEGCGTEVFEFNPKLLGKFKIKTTVVKDK